VLAPLALILGFVKLLMFYRANAMRALASRWGFQYIGPPALRFWSLWFRSSTEIAPPLPVSFPLAYYPASEIGQVWNLIEGQQSGVSVLIFDSYLGKVKGSYCTFIACQTEKNPFGTDTDRVIQSGGWTALYRFSFLSTPWTMSARRLDDHVNRLRVASTCRA
jgi:hypothetical protein